MRVASDTYLVEEIDHALKALQSTLIVSPTGIAADVTRIVWLWERHKTDFFELRALYRKITQT